MLSIFCGCSSRIRENNQAAVIPGKKNEDEASSKATKTKVQEATIHQVEKKDVAEQEKAIVDAKKELEETQLSTERSEKLPYAQNAKIYAELKEYALDLLEQTQKKNGLPLEDNDTLMNFKSQCPEFDHKKRQREHMTLFIHNSVRDILKSKLDEMNDVITEERGVQKTRGIKRMIRVLNWKLSQFPECRALAPENQEIMDDLKSTLDAVKMKQKEDCKQMEAAQTSRMSCDTRQYISQVVTCLILAQSNGSLRIDLEASALFVNLNSRYPMVLETVVMTNIEMINEIKELATCLGIQDLRFSLSYPENTKRDNESIEIALKESFVDITWEADIEESAKEVQKNLLTLSIYNQTIESVDTCAIREELIRLREALRKKMQLLSKKENSLNPGNLLKKIYQTHFLGSDQREFEKLWQNIQIDKPAERVRKGSCFQTEDPNIDL